MRLPPRSGDRPAPDDLLVLHERVPEHPVAPDRNDPPEGRILPPARIELSITISHDDKQGLDLLDMLIDHISKGVK